MPVSVDSEETSFAQLFLFTHNVPGCRMAHIQYSRMVRPVSDMSVE